MNERLLSAQEVLDFAVDQAMDVSQGIYDDAISLGLAIAHEAIGDDDACVQFKELRAALEKAKEES